MPGRAAHHTLVFLALFGFWVVLSGKLDAVHLGMGAFSAALVTALSGRQLFSRDDKGEERWLTMMPWGRLLLYWPWLGLEIVKANIQVLKLVLGPIDRLSPAVVKTAPGLSSEVSRATLANSITLTPGTVTLDIEEDGTFLVHAIDTGSAEGLLEGTMQQKVADVFGEPGPAGAQATDVPKADDTPPEEDAT